jgi:hypothetical protein
MEIPMSQGVALGYTNPPFQGFSSLSWRLCLSTPFKTLFIKDVIKD